MSESQFDLSDPTTFFRPDVIADPRPLYQALREHAPVWEIPGTTTFVVTSMALVSEAVARPEDFSSNLLSLVYQGEGGHPLTLDLSPLGDAIRVLATADAPVHTAHRKLLQSRLTPGRIGALETDIGVMVDHMLDGMIAAGRGEVVSELADPLPAQVISRLLGLPDEDLPVLIDLVRANDQILAGVVDTTQIQAAMAGAGNSAAYLATHLQRAVAGEADVTVLDALADTVRAEMMTFQEAIGILLQVIGAGVSTTTGFLEFAIRSLAEDEQLQNRLRADGAAIPTFLEETLRVSGPFQFHYRSTTHPTTLGGIDIPAGARVLMMWAAANLDDVAFANADQVDLDRPVVKSHIAFGRGLHFCIGAPLARLEGRITIERLLHRTRHVALDPADPPRIRPSIFMRQLASLPVVIE